MSPINIEIEAPAELYNALREFVSGRLTDKESSYFIDPDRYIELRDVTEAMSKRAITKVVQYTNGDSNEIHVIPRAVETYFGAKGGVWSQEPGIVGRTIVNKQYIEAYKELKALGVGDGSKVGLCSGLWNDLREIPLFKQLLDWAHQVVTELEKKKDVRERIKKMHSDIDALGRQIDVSGVREELEKIPVPDYVYDDNRKYYVLMFQLFNRVLKDLGIPFAQSMRCWCSTWFWYPEYFDWCDRDYDVASEKTKGTRHPYVRISAGKKTTDEDHSVKVSTTIRDLGNVIQNAAPQIEMSLPGPEKLPRLTQEIGKEIEDEEEV